MRACASCVASCSGVLLHTDACLACTLTGPAVAISLVRATSGLSRSPLRADLCGEAANGSGARLNYRLVGSLVRSVGGTLHAPLSPVEPQEAFQGGRTLLGVHVLAVEANSKEVHAGRKLNSYT